MFALSTFHHFCITLKPLLLLLLLPRRSLRSWLSSWATLSSMPKEERLRLLREENAWKNDLVMWAFPDSVRAQLPHFVQTWLRCWILCAAVYFGEGGLWCYYTYFCFGDVFFKPGTIPGTADILEQMKVGGTFAWLGARRQLHMAGFPVQPEGRGVVAQSVMPWVTHLAAHGAAQEEQRGVGIAPPESDSMWGQRDCELASGVQGMREGFTCPHSLQRHLVYSPRTLSIWVCAGLQHCYAALLNAAHHH